MESFQSLLSAAKKAGITTEAITDQNSLTPQEIFTKMKDLPFWCGDNIKHKINPEYYNDFCCTQHVAGLPVHPATHLEMPPTNYQLEFVDVIIKAVTKPEEMSQIEWDRLPHMFHILKGRQMGFTEFVLRLIFHFCFTRYAPGSNIAIIAAVNGNLARKNLRRFMRLFTHIRSVVPNGIKSNVVNITNDIQVEAFPASEEAITGLTDFAAVFPDESGKWRLVDDSPVFNSLLPIVRSNGADLFLVSTFKGPVKTFYRIWRDKDTDYIFLEYNIERTVGNLYTREQVDNMMNASTEDPQQEYMCSASSGRDSIFGIVTKDDKQGMSEWLDDDDEGGEGGEGEEPKEESPDMDWHTLDSDEN